MRRRHLWQVGISATGGGHYFSKVERAWQVDGKEWMLSVEDPKDSTNDICRWASRAPHVCVCWAVDMGSGSLGGGGVGLSPGV